MMGEPDRLLRLFERDMLIAVGVQMVLAWLLVDDGVWMAAAVAGGGALAWYSYTTVKAGVDAGVRRKTSRWALVKSFTRYAILAVAAYVILARLRLHPVGVVAGASTLVLAAATTAVRALRARESLRTGE